MSQGTAAPADEIVLPAPYHLLNHLNLPCEDGSFVRNSQEPPQSMLLSDALRPVLQRRHPDGRYFIGQDCGIYWNRVPPPGYQATAPDWYYVPDVAADRNGVPRRSYVMWVEHRAPLIALEFVSGNGSEERDRTPEVGKFWIYENVIHAHYYGIYERDPGRVEVYHLEDGRYVPMPANERGHFPIPPLGVELGIWHGTFENMTVPWLRWYDAEGRLLPTSDEQADYERQRADQERQRAESLAVQANQERQRADTLAAEVERLRERLRALGQPLNGGPPE